ncbi:MAG: hypothetical protein H7062_21445 [Candidatus Saccharimonas sp.]|nr:hypothetical protein [Planctomycetaceae bacterium]
MKKTRWGMSWVGAGLTVLLWGCGAGKTAPATKPVVPEAVPASQASDGAKPETGSVTAPIQKVADDSALAAVRQTLSAIERGDLAKAYEFLPPGYQSDVDGLVHEFASKMDAEVWTRLFGTLRKTVAVLRAKKAFILELDLFANRPEYESLRKHWDEAVSLLDAFVTSSAGDLESLQQASAKSLLPGDAARVVQHLDAIGLGVGADLARQFADIKVEQIKATGDEHVLSFQGPRDERPTEIAYVKHDGRWLPKTLVAQWSAGIEADRAWLAKLPDQIKVAKPRVLEALTQADGLLDQLLAAKNRDEFQQAVGPAILSLALAWPRMQQLAQQSASGKNEQPPVTIFVNRELSASEQTKMIESVLKPLHATGTDYTLLANDGKTTCRLTKVADVASLRESLAKHFGLQPDGVSFDQESSQLKVELER